MSAAPYFRLFFSDLAGDTLGLTDAEFGSYMLLLGAMWNAGGALPSDPSRLARMARCSPKVWARRWAVLGAYFEIDGDEITNSRLRSERKKVEDLTQERRAAGKRGAKAKALKNKETPSANASANTVAKPKHTITTVETASTKLVSTGGEIADDRPNGPSPPRLELVPEPEPTEPIDVARRAVVAGCGENFAWKHFDGSELFDGVLRPVNDIARAGLLKRAAGILAEHAITIGEPIPPVAQATA